MALTVSLPAVASSVTAILSSTTQPIFPTITPHLITAFTPSSVWNNEPFVALGVIYSACYPPEFITSYLDSLKGIISPAFSPLDCPATYYTVSTRFIDAYQSHVVCCPSSYSFHPSNTTQSQRPFGAGTCYSEISGTTVQSYDGTVFSTILFSTAGQAYGHAIDGIAQGQTSTSASTPSSTTVTSQSHSTESATSSKGPQHWKLGVGIGVSVGGGLLVGLIALGVWSCRKRQQNKQKERASRAGNPNSPERSVGTLSQNELNYRYGT